MNEPWMKIGEIAAFFGVSVKAIRMYEKKGILVPARVDPDTGYRYYTADQIQVLGTLLELKTLGFSLAEIKKLLKGGMESEQFQAALTQRRTAWQERIAVAEDRIDAINRIAERIEQANDTGKFGSLTEEQRALLLVKMVCVEDMRGHSTLREAIWL